MAGLHWLDYVILSGFLAVSLAIGLFQACTGGRQSTVEEYLLDNRKLRVIPTVLSMLASGRSAASIIGSSGELFNWGTQLFFVGEILSSAIAVVIVERFVVPWLYRLQLTSSYEYLELRFQSKAVRRLASAIGIANAVIFTGTAFLAPSVALEVASNFPLTLNIFLLASFCTVYAAIGGLRGIIWNDVLQFALMSGGILFILLEGCKSIGSFHQVLEIAREKDRLLFAEFDPHPNMRISFWTIMFGHTIYLIYYCGFYQMMVQRYVALPSLREARLVMLLGTPVSFIFTLACASISLVQFAYFTKADCDPLQSRLISSPNQIFPLFMRLFFSTYKGATGIFLLTLYGSSLSTASSLLSGLAANTYEDFLKPLLDSHTSEFQATLVNKALVVIYAILATGAAFGLRNLPTNIYVVTVMFLGAAGGPSVGLFALGGLTVRTEWIGALTGGLAGFLVNAVFITGSIVTKAGWHQPLPSVSSTGCLQLLNATKSSEFMETINFAFIGHNHSQRYSYYDKTDVYYPIIPLKGIKKMFGVSTFLYPLFGALTTVLVGYFVSVIVIHGCLRKQCRTVDQRYLISCKDAVYAFKKETRIVSSLHNMNLEM